MHKNATPMPAYKARLHGFRAYLKRNAARKRKDANDHRAKNHFPLLVGEDEDAATALEEACAELLRLFPELSA